MIKHILSEKEKQKIINIIELLRSTDKECCLLGISVLKEEINLNASYLIESVSGIGNFYIDIQACMHSFGSLANLLNSFINLGYYYLPEN